MQAEPPAAPALRRRSAAPSCRSSKSRAEPPGPAPRAQPRLVGRARRRATSRASSTTSTASGPGGSTLRPFELEEVGDVAGQAARPPAVPFRPRHALVGAAGRLGRRASTSPRPAVEAANALAARDRPRRPVRRSRRLRRRRGARRRAVRHRLHRASARSTGSPTCRAGRASSPRCSRRAGSSTWASFTRSPGCSPTTTSSVELDYFHDPEGERFDDGSRAATRTSRPRPRNNVDARVGAHDLRRGQRGARRRPAARALQRARLHHFPRCRQLEVDRDAREVGDVYRPPAGFPRLPLMYSLRARRD